jgi:hypothetical protein
MTQPSEADLRRLREAGLTLADGPFVYDDDGGVHLGQCPDAGYPGCGACRRRAAAILSPAPQVTKKDGRGQRSKVPRLGYCSHAEPECDLCFRRRRENEWSKASYQRNRAKRDAYQREYDRRKREEAKQEAREALILRKLKAGHRAGCIILGVAPDEGTIREEECACPGCSPQLWPPDFPGPDGLLTDVAWEVATAARPIPRGRGMSCT